MEKTRIAIGVPTYNDCTRIRNLFQSIVTFTDYPEDQYKMVMLDDGTPDQSKVEGLRQLSREFDIPLIENQKNEGIPYSWNRLTEYYDTEYMILFNDDIQVISGNWLRDFIYFMENNPHAGSIGWPIIHVDVNTGKRNEIHDLPNEDVQPGRVGASLGCCFGFRKKLWEQIKNPDSSVGFYENLISFYEEIGFGFEIAKQGYYNYQLPTPTMEHWGSQTFSNNRELSVRKISDYLSKEEYLSILRKQVDKLAIDFSEHERLADTENLAYRMDYARVMFAKKWECSDFWSTPQVETQQRYIDTQEKKLTKWIDKNRQEQEAVL